MSIDTTRFDQWDSEFDQQRVEQVQQQLVAKHDGDIVHIPQALAAAILGDYLQELETAVASGEITQTEITRYVYAKCLHNSVHDEWNGRWK